MKHLHRLALYGWSRFDEARNMDFNSVLWLREGGNVVIDPLPLSAHESRRLQDFGGASHIVITNSDHVRGAAALAAATGARIYGPAAERENFPIACDEWLSDGDRPFPGLDVVAMEGSKTPGELALLIDEATLVTGDLIRAQHGGALHLLPRDKLRDERRAIASVRRLLGFRSLDSVLVGDGWPVFRGARKLLEELVNNFETERAVNR